MVSQLQAPTSCGLARGYTAIDFGHSLTNEALATQALHSAMQADLPRSDYHQYMDAVASRIAEESVWRARRGMSYSPAVR